MSVSDLSQSHQKLEVDDQEIIESMSEVLDALLNAMPALGTAEPAPTTALLTGAIDIITGSSASLTIRTEESTAMKLAEGWALVGDDGSPSSEDAVDAMSEFTNLIGGAMKFLLSEESALGLPTVEVITGDPAPDSWHWIDVFHPVGQFQIELHSTAGQ